MQHDRRTFLALLGGAACAALLTRRLRATPAAVVGVQLYTVRGEMRRDVEATLARVAEIGYGEVEFAGYFERTPAQLRAALRATGLVAPSTHVSLSEVESAWPTLVEQAHIIGHSFITVPSLPNPRPRSTDDWRRLAEQFNAAGTQATRAGLRFAFHNHNYEFTPVGDVVPFDILLAETDPALVTFELDVYWAARAGADPVQYLERHPERFSMLHLKDSGGAPEHEMRDVGAGVIDFRRLLDVARRGRVQHAFVEHDSPADAFASIRASLQHLKTIEP